MPDMDAIAECLTKLVERQWSQHLFHFLLRICPARVYFPCCGKQRRQLVFDERTKYAAFEYDMCLCV